MPDTGLAPRLNGTSGLTNRQFAGFAGLITLAGALYAAVTFVQSQNDRTAAEARARENLANQVSQLQASINAMAPRVDLVVSLQGELRSLTAGMARIEAQSSPIPGQIRDLDRTLVAQQAAVTGHQKDIDAIRVDVTAIKADVIRRGEQTTANLNQLRDYFFRMQRNGSLNDMGQPDKMQDSITMPQRVDRNREADYRPKPFAAPGSQWVSAGRLLGVCGPTVN